MKVQLKNQYTYNRSKISFQSQRLYPFKLEKPDKDCYCFFSRLEKSDVLRLFKDRENIKNSEYGYIIFRTFVRELNGKEYGGDYFAIESKDGEIKGLADIFEGRNWIEINHLQALRKPFECIKGIGTGLLYGICKLAKEKGHIMVELDAANRELFDYYKNLGFKQTEHNPFHFYLTDQDYASFLKNIERIYEDYKYED